MIKKCERCGINVVKQRVNRFCSRHCASIGNSNMKGKTNKWGHHSEETRRKIGEGNRGKIVQKDSRRLISLAVKKRWLDIAFRKRYSENAKINPNFGNKGKHLSVEQRNAMSERSKKMWKNKEYREKTVTAILNAMTIRPSAYEKIMIDIIKRNNLRYKYVGDCTLIIGYKNPDFVNIDGKKILIEVYSTYFKIKNHKSEERYKKIRSNHFAKYGYKTIFINGTELKDENLILNKITSEEANEN